MTIFIHSNQIKYISFFILISKMIKIITATFIVTFIAFVINMSIDYYETKFANDYTQQVLIQGGEMNVK